MKKTLTTIAALLAVVTIAVAVDETITNYFAGYRYVPATFTNAGTTGLSPSNGYLCIPITALSNITTTQAAHASGDVRAVMYSINQSYYAAWTNETATNRSVSIPTKSSSYATSGTNVNEIVFHNLRTVRKLGSATLP